MIARSGLPRDLQAFQGHAACSERTAAAAAAPKKTTTATSTASSGAVIIPASTPSGAPDTRPMPTTPTTSDPTSTPTAAACPDAWAPQPVIDTRMLVPQWFPRPIGTAAFPGEGASMEVWASGTPVQPDTGFTSTSLSHIDESAADIVDSLFVAGQPPTTGSTRGTYSNVVSPTNFAGVAFIDASAGVLTYTETLAVEAGSWSIADPSRTAQTSNIGSDLFVRGITPGRFFAYQLTLVTPSDCALQALTNALGAQATLTDGTHHGGIFSPTNREPTQATLTANGATLFVKVVANVAMPQVEALLAATTCSTADLGACQKLADDLSAAWNDNVAPSDLAKLQAGTDLAWSLTIYEAAPVSLLND